MAKRGISKVRKGESIESGVIPIATLAPDPKNPRKMDAAARAGLGVSMETFGALDIVFNDETGQLVSGHQRIAALKEAGAVELVRSGDAGYIEHPKTRERFPVRFVRWDATKQRMANLVANNPEIQGEFTPDVVEQLRALDDEVGYEELRLRALLEAENDSVNQDESQGTDTGEDQSGELRESFQIVVTCVDEAHQSTLLERFAEEGLKCRALI